MLRFSSALEAVRGTGYGVVVPELGEVEIEEPDGDETGK